jgi:3,4-dihydroxy 2-butanone 4-phosphate synthase/GTP cyclohydrolase II
MSRVALAPQADDVACVAALRSGRPVVFWCGDLPDPLAVLAVPAVSITASAMAFLVTNCSGLVCVTVPADDCRRLGLTAMSLCDDENAPMAQARVSVDAAEGVGTGISARDRAHTTRLLADPASGRDTFRRPGHVLTVRVDRGGHRGIAQPVADLMRSAGLGGFGVYSHLVDETGLHLADLATATAFAAAHGLPLTGQGV